MTASSTGVSDRAPRGTPEAAEVKAELERVLASRCFAQADRAKEFLRFVVEETVAGRGDRLKGYTIAVEVFGRPADFDAQSDPLVRVEAGRLRRRLAEYYSTEGVDDPVRIGLARGGYTTQFAYAAEPQPADDSPATRRVLATQLRGPALLGAAVALAVVASIWLGYVLLDGERAPERIAIADRFESTPAAERAPRLLVVPFENISGSSDLDYFAYGVTEEIALSLMDFDVLVIAGPRAPRESGESGESESPPIAASGADAGYVLSGTVRNSADRIRITARLVAADTGVQLWSEAFDESLDVRTLISIEARIATRVATTIARPYGPIFEQEIAKATRKPAEHLDAYDCVLRYRYYRRTLDANEHRRITACFERAVVTEPGLADVWAGLALGYLDEHLYGYNREVREPDALTRAHEAARTALDIEGQNRLANLAIARVRFALGDIEGFERAAERLLAMSPNNPDDLVLLAALRGIAGEWDRALPLIDKAQALTAGRLPGIYSIVRALYAVQTGDYDEALERALEADTPNWYLSQMIVAAAAASAGRPDIARRAAARVRELDPAFATDARTELAKWHPNETLLARILEGLTTAGLATP